MISYEGRNRRTVNLLKTMYFDNPEWAPCRVALMSGTWMKHREALEDLVLRHPRLFPGFQKGSKDFDRIDNLTYRLGRHTDCWGCVWENVEAGLESMVVTHPLADWNDFKTWRPPDPLTQNSFGPRQPWEKVAEALAQSKAKGNLVIGGGLPHGFFYMRLADLRGFENLMMDLATDEPMLGKLINIVEGYNVSVIGKFLEIGAEYIVMGEDLGMQKSLPMSPATWRKYIKPSYEAMFGPCRDRDIPVYLHSDGHILEIIPDLIEVGVRVINPQIRANGLDGIRDTIKGRVAMELDLDRQLFPFASPSEVENHIGEAFETLHSPEGGFMMVAECEPDVPLENIEAICSTIEKLCNPPLPDAV